jgi:hypothetical protein
MRLTNLTDTNWMDKRWRRSFGRAEYNSKPPTSLDAHYKS